MGKRNLDPVHLLRVQSVLGTSPGLSVWPANARRTRGIRLKHRTGTNWCHPPALGNLVPWSLGGLRSGFVAWTRLLLCGDGSTGDMVAGDMVPFAETRGMRVPAAFQLATGKPSGSNDFPRLLLCVGSEFPTQR